MKSTIITLTILFAGFLSAKTQVPVKAGFEDWCTVQPISFEDVECWDSPNPMCSSLGLPSSITLTDDAYKGTYALKLETGMDEMGLPLIAEAIYKDKIYSRPEKFTGYCKADLKEDDYAIINISFMSDRGQIGWGSLNIEKSSDIFYRFEIPIHYLSTIMQPDSFAIYIYSSSGKAKVGTTIIIDDLAFETMTDVTIPLAEPFLTRITPNPSTDDILVELPKELGLVYFRIFDSNGRIMEYQTFEYQVRINVSEYIPGLYIYEVRLPNNEIYDKGRIRVAEHGS
jgi:hypothetical protein